MSWFRIDDDWADSPKVDAISDVAARLWSMCGCWCSKRKNLWLDGFVPRAALETITKRRWPDEVLEQAIHDLVETSKVGGVHEFGLWEPREGGWRFHDWEQYRPRDEELEPDMPARRSQAASIAGKVSAAVRRAKNGTAQPKKGASSPERLSNEGPQIPLGSSNDSRTTPERLPNDEEPFEKSFGERSGNRSEIFSNVVSNVVSNDSRTSTHKNIDVSRTAPRTTLERPEPPVPDPVPDPRSDLPKAAAASQRPDRLSREPERQQLRRESDPKPIPQPAQPAPEPPSGTHPAASGPRRSIPTSEREPGALADSSQNCHSSNSEEQPRPPTRRERATSDLASLPIAELARRCRENPHDAGFAAPQDRPEVRQVHEAWCRSVGLTVRKLGYLSDKNRPLWAILEALETNSLADVLRACEQASRDPWCRGEKPGRNGEPGRKRGVEELSPVVLRRLLDAADERKPEIRSASVQKAMDAVDAVLAGQR